MERKYFGEVEPSQGLYRVQSGTLKALKNSTAGREQFLHSIKSGQTLNEEGSFTALPNPASLMSLIPSQVWHIPGEAIRHLIHKDPMFAELIIDVLSERLRNSVTLVEDRSLRLVINRLAGLNLDEADGDRLFQLAWNTQNKLAARSGTVADVIQRSLRKLETGYLIVVEGQQILINDRNKLEKLAV